MLRQFHKMHGLGNDFVILDAREQPLEMTEALARHIADRREGIGCDQLILLEHSDRADLRMRIFNADGSEVQSCGNATRCVVRLTGAATIETAGGLLSGASEGDAVEVTLVEPRFEWDAIPLAYPLPTDPLPMGWENLDRPYAVNVGNPHLVFFVDDLEDADLEGIGPGIETDPLFPERINVNVASVGVNSIRLRTFERGAGLTRACGTGACATAIAAIRTRLASSPVNVHMAGGSLTIAWAPGEPVRMRGSATHVFKGFIDLP
ncbi:diaminopimelate epimerase [Sphingomonas glaciei]|uniref:Diaminopimelate epimerase n=1 Tax=Sphingomonas glaciei TaxID=2938948 RepID=A0ABY5MVU1_9SPHN|nr:diaminopimelate epimerase [Sphingomonas glaciei]UUR08570.1 diaminopimelate epimerase [Sphingomonas glaciei]